MAPLQSEMFNQTRHQKIKHNKPLYYCLQYLPHQCQPFKNKILIFAYNIVTMGL